ncbi:hypothetical protein M426DRAFT_325980 [Hypoxylon sp. CI-4A]|nr:hypothetical protein M426DRAFT_325980 [Hypoxylon sp. CI-4A]
MGDTIFFEGSLQDGIALAIQQSKVVLAFVTDDSGESQVWETELTTNDTLRSPLSSYCVFLRLTAGSQEAGFLEALFPIPKKPTVVVIQNGILKEYITGGTPTQDLVRRIAAILNATTTGQGGQTASTSASQTQPVPAPEASSSVPSNDLDDLYDDHDEDVPSASAPAPAPAPAPIEAEWGQNTRRAQRLAAEKKAREAKAKAEQEAQEKKRHQEANKSSESQPSSQPSTGRSYQEEVRQRKREAAEERKRILKRIEDDRRERREREAKERQARLLLSNAQESEESTSQTPAIPLPRRQVSGSTQGDHCNLQVRLFDGSTIRSRFKSDATLSSEVRKWIDEDRTDGDAPYTFRIVLSPLPNKAIEPAEETESLLSLGLAPSATLVLVPAKYSSAYASSGGFVWRGLSYILGIFGAMYGFLAGVFVNRPNEQTPEGVPLRNLGPANARAASRIRGFRNEEDERRDAQLYNGNSLNFEPRRDNDDDNDEGGR